MTYLTAFLSGAALGCWIGAMLRPYSAHLPLPTVVLMYLWSGALTGGALGIAAAYRWPLPPPEHVMKGQPKGGN
jgi:hypothetical protein